MARAHDSQRAKVYNWERAHVPGWQPARWCRIDDELSLEDCTALVIQIWKDYHPGQMPPRVTPGHMARRATGCRERINLPCWARQMPVVLHETAHSLQPMVQRKDAADDPMGGRLVSVAWHGPEFVRLYIELLVRYHRPCRGQRVELLRSARGGAPGAVNRRILKGR